MRLVSALLALAMLFVMMPVGAFADNVSPKRGSCGAKGDNITWKVEQNSDTANDREQGWTLTLEGSGEMADYGKAYDDPNGAVPWESVRNRITQVSIPQGVTRIGNSALWGMVSLENVTIPDGVMTIGDNAFDGCGVTKIVLPDSVTRIGKEAFLNCGSLEEVKLSKSLTDIEDSTFSNCSELKQMDIPEGVTTIGMQAFSGCASLRNINIYDSVTNIGAAAFYGCASLSNITIPTGVTTIGPMTFELCISLKNITIPQQVETIGERAFATCAQLEKIDIAKGSNLTTVGGHAFETNCMYEGGQSVDLSKLPKDKLSEAGIAQLAETKIYCDAPLKKSGKLSNKGVAEENIIASVTVKLVDDEQTKTWNVPYGGTYGETVGTLEKPTKEGYTFVDWYDEKGNVFDPTAPLTEDTTIHAEWKKDAAPAPTPAPTPAPAPVDDDSVDAGAVATTVVLGAGVAALAYHIGTELYAEQVLGKGVVVPTLRGDVARKAWELAGKPAVTVAGNEAPDEDAQAQQWVVDQGLMKDRKDGKFHPEQWMSKLKALRTLDAAKKLG